MPKTKKKFNWEIYDEQDEFLDILCMSRSEAKAYMLNFPNYKCLEIEYTDV